MPTVDSAHVQAARRIVAFLLDETELEQGLLADRVELRVAPEGDGDRLRFRDVFVPLSDISSRRQ